MAYLNVVKKLLFSLTMLQSFASAYWGYRPWPAYIPMSAVMPGGKGQAYLSDMTEEYGDEMAARIDHLSNEVSHMGHVVQNIAGYGSDMVDHVSHIVDSDDSDVYHPQIFYPEMDEGENEDEDDK